MSPRKKHKSRRRTDSDAVANNTQVQKRSKTSRFPDGEPESQPYELEQPRRSGRAGAGSGGRVATLEKIGSVLEAAKQPRKTTDVPEGIVGNPLAPERPDRGRGAKKFGLVPTLPCPAPVAETASSAPVPVYHQRSADSPRFGFIPQGADSQLTTSGTRVPTGNARSSQPPSRSFVRQPEPSQPLYGNHSAVQSTPREAPTGISAAQIDPVLLAGSALHPKPRPLARVSNPATYSDTARTADHDKDSSNSTTSSSSEEQSENTDSERDGPDGWCSTNRRETTHPGFSQEPRTSVSLRHTSLPLEPEFEYSRDEDDNAAQRLLREQDEPSPQITQPRGNVVDVLDSHHQTNGRPVPPQPSRLANASNAVNQVQPNVVHESPNVVVNQAQVDVESRPRAPRNSKKSKDDPVAPDTLAFYPPVWKDLLEDGKRSCRIAHIIKNPFPSKSRDLKTSITESLVTTVVEWSQNGSTLEPGFWPKHQNDMASLLLADVATWRSELKSVAINLAPSVYGLVAPADIQDRYPWVKSRAAELLEQSVFLRGGYDENGKTKNFGHLALKQAITEFFYIGTYRVADKRPDLFRGSVPVPCLALVAAAFNCVLDGFARNGSGRGIPQFSSKSYASIYRSLLSMADEVLKNPYHGPRLEEQLAAWGNEAW